MKVNYSIFTPSGDKVFDGFELFTLFGWTFGVHRFTGADAPGCFHTHFGVAYRLILWGGYVEEVLLTEGGCDICDDYICGCPLRRCVELRTWFPGRFGRITHDYEHRIDRLLNGRSSWSFWIRGPITHPINTRGC